MMVQDNRMADIAAMFGKKLMELLKKQFLMAPIFAGKSFWQVEKDLIWVDE